MGSSCSIHLPMRISPSNSLTSSYHIRSILGKGGYATVYLAKHRYYKNVAIKRTKFVNIKNVHTDVTMAIAELEALKRIDTHPYITKMHAAFRQNNNCFLVLEYHSGGDLRYYQKSQICSFREHQVAYFISCIGAALHHLHCRNIIHRDVKPENILLTSSGVPKLSDFGTAYMEEEFVVPISDYSSGTLPYMAPELLTLSRYHSYQSDFWSLGITAFELLFNSRPFHKNCPKHFIHFAANQYHYLWETLIMRSQQSIKGTESLNFKEIDSQISNEARVSSYPFPKYHIPLYGDGSLPFELTVPIPLAASCGEYLSLECVNFVQSMLDVRIPHRLGQITEFELFSNHPWFQKHGCSNFSASDSDRLPPSPFTPNIASVESFLSSKYKQDPMMKDPLAQSMIKNELIPEYIELKLQNYHYESPRPSQTNFLPLSIMKARSASTKCNTEADSSEEILGL